MQLEIPPSDGVEKVIEDPKNLSPPPTNIYVPVEDTIGQGGHRDPSPPAIVHEVVVLLKRKTDLFLCLLLGRTSP